jgi:hypothetical protein
MPTWLADRDAFLPAYGFRDWAPLTWRLVEAGFRAPFVPAVQELAGTPVDGERWHDWWAAAATRFAELVAAVLDRLARTPLAALKSGGVGNREAGRAARALDCTEPELRLVLSLLSEAGVLHETAAGWRPAPGADEWRARPAAATAADLLARWWTLPYNPTQSVDDGRPVPALRPRPHAGAVEARQALLQSWATVPGGRAVAAEHLAAHALWHRPLLYLPEGEESPFATVLEEAALLGLAAASALTPLGRALAAGRRNELQVGLAAVLPAAGEVALFGADLTAVVAGVPAPAVSRLLDAVADREGSGGATVWRFTPGSVRRALDEGRTADDLVAGLTALATTQLPQPVEYLVRDVARDHGHIRVAPSTSVLRSDDEALVRRLAGDRALRALGLRQIAPTVLVADADAEVVLTTLRGAGYLPMPDGQLMRVERPRDPTPPATAQAPSTEVKSPSQPLDAATVAQRLLREPASAESPTEVRLLSIGGDGLGTDELRLLAHAVDTGEPVIIDYLSSSGRVTQRTISRADISVGLLTAYCHLRADERYFRVDRIEAVLPAPAG